MLWTLQGVIILDVKLLVMHIMHDHVHAAEVVRGRIAFLAVEGTYFLYFLGHAQQ